MPAATGPDGVLYAPLPHPELGIVPALQPAPNYRELAQSVLDNAPAVRNFLVACANCGLPADERIRAHEQAVQFAQAFIHNFYPNP